MTSLLSRRLGSKASKTWLLESFSFCLARVSFLSFLPWRIVGLWPSGWGVDQKHPHILRWGGRRSSLKPSWESALCPGSTRLWENSIWVFRQSHDSRIAPEMFLLREATDCLAFSSRPLPSLERQGGGNYGGAGETPLTLCLWLNSVLRRETLKGSYHLY